MKILYLLFSVVFLVLMNAPGFSRAIVTPGGCKHRGGFCFFWRCPTPSEYFDKCIPYGHCCRKK